MSSKQIEIALMKNLLTLFSLLLTICVLSCKRATSSKQRENDIMKIAAIYDIHANPIALKAVLNDIESINVDLIVVGGDVVSGPMPKETLRLLQDVTTPTKFILGNAESEVLRYLNGEEINGLTERANEEARWVSGQLSLEQRNFIAGWSKTEIIELKNLKTTLFCHGTPRSDVEIFTKETSEEKLKQIFKNTVAQTVICGHTHMQFDIKEEGIRIVNAGSVGMPFGKTGADWLLIDSTINFRHSHYDLEEAAQTYTKFKLSSCRKFCDK